MTAKSKTAVEILKEKLRDIKFAVDINQTKKETNFEKIAEKAAKARLTFDEYLPQ